MSSKNSTTDCLACRLVSGFGVVGIGVYLYAQSRNRSKLEGGLIKMLSAGTIGVGVARLMNAEFLKADDKTRSTTK